MPHRTAFRPTCAAPSGAERREGIHNLALAALAAVARRRAEVATPKRVATPSPSRAKGRIMATAD